MMAQVGEEARPLPEVRPEVPAELWAVMAKMLAKKPEDRYQTPREVEQALRPFVTGSAKPVRPGSGQQPGLVKAATLLPGNT
jgi:NADH:ubiquinone oxidoreductase subunit